MKTESYLQLSDEELMEAYRLGDPHAFEELYRRHAGKVCGYVRRRLPEPRVNDAVQDIFLKLHKNRGRYDKNFPFLPWLFAIAHHLLIDSTRKERRSEELVERDFLESFPSPAAASVEGVLSESGRTLSAQEREILSLHFGDGFQFDEIATRLRLGASNTRKISSRAIRKLRDFFGVKQGT